MLLRRNRALLVISALFVTLSAAKGAAQDPPKSQFTILKGKDTVAVERFSRDGPVVTGTLTQSNGVKTEYVVNLRPDERVEHIELQRQPAQGPAISMSIDFGDTLISAQFEGGGQKQQMTFPTPLKPMPYLVNSFVLLEQIARASHPEAGKTVKWMAARLGAGDTVSISVTRGQADTVVISAPNGDTKLAVGKDGSVVGAVFAPQGWVVERKAVKP